MRGPSIPTIPHTRPRTHLGRSRFLFAHHCERIAPSASGLTANAASATLPRVMRAVGVSQRERVHGGSNA